MKDQTDYFKADIFSFGATLYELITSKMINLYIRLIRNIDCDLAKDEAEKLKMRQGNFEMIDRVNIYSSRLKNMVKRMLDPNPKTRPTACDLLTILPSRFELELKWEKASKFLLNDKLREYQKKIQEISIKRRLSI